MKSLLKAIDTIDAVAEAGNAGIRELSSITGYPPSTIHRIVTTLVDKHYFQQDPITKRYSLASRFLELGSRFQQQTHLTAIALPHLEQLMAAAREIVNLAVRDGDSSNNDYKGEFLHRAARPLVANIGRGAGPATSASGDLLFLPPCLDIPL